MGSMFKTPKVQEDPELKKQKVEQAKINKQEEERQALVASEKKRKITSNLIGARSLQSAELEDFSGFRRKDLKTKENKTMGGYSA